MSEYKVLYFSYCTGCNKLFEHYSELNQDALLKDYAFLDGNVITGYVDSFITTKERNICDCYKTGLDGRQIFFDKGVILGQKYDVIREIFQMDREEFSRSAKRIRLQREWKEELETNEMYKCLDCGQSFYQPLSDELDKICPPCEMEKHKRGMLQESPKGMYEAESSPEGEDSCRGEIEARDESPSFNRGESQTESPIPDEDTSLDS